ncbi:MAG: hypothetical protein GXY83_29400 [Rhodopirellula sp.]|nr:hypothetical protein [Rhodopirellula sp.]
MVPNRMQRYFSASERRPLVSAMPSPCCGFTLIPMAAFPSSMQQMIVGQQLLYGLAYLAAQEEIQFWYGDDLLDYSI